MKGSLLIMMMRVCVVVVGSSKKRGSIFLCFFIQMRSIPYATDLIFRLFYIF